MLVRLLLLEHFQILGSYFLPHTNTVILLDSYCGIIKETGLFSPGFPNYLESVRVNIGFPVVRTDGRSFGRCTVKWLQNVSGMGRFGYPWCSAGAPESSAIIKNNYLIHCLCAWYFYVNSPALCTLYAKPCRFPLRTLIHMVACLI